MAKLPEYQPLVGPPAYRGPTPLQVQQSLSMGLSGGQAAAAILESTLGTLSEAALDYWQKQQEFRRAAKATYDKAQLAKAEKAYWAALKHSVEITIPSSGKVITDWDEMYEEEKKKAYAVAVKYLESAQTTFKGGGEFQATVMDDFESFVLEWDQTWESQLFKNQSLALLDSASGAAQEDIVMLRTNPDYLPIALQHMDNYMANYPGFSREAGEKTKEAMRSVARIATYEIAFEKLAKEIGVDEAYAKFTDPEFKLDTPLGPLAEEERDRVLQTLARKVNSVHAIAENNLNLRIDPVNADAMDMFYRPEEHGWLTTAKVDEMFTLLKDTNAPGASDRAQRLKEHWYGMIKARDSAAASNRVNPNTQTNEQLKVQLIMGIDQGKEIAMDKNGNWYVTQKPAPREWFDRFLETHVGVDKAGNPQLNDSDHSYLKTLLDKEIPNDYLNQAISTLRSAVTKGVLREEDMGKAVTELTNAEADHALAVKKWGADKVKPLDAEFYTNVVQNVIDNALTKTKTGAASVPDLVRQIYSEARATSFYPQRGGKKGMVNLDALTYGSQDGNFAGLLHSQEWKPIAETGATQYANMFVEKMTGTKNRTDISLYPTSEPNVYVFEYEDPATKEKKTAIISTTDSGHFVIQMESTDFGALYQNVAGAGVIQTWKPTEKTFFLMPVYDKKTDKIGFAQYDPLRDEPLIDSATGGPLLYPFIEGQPIKNPTGALPKEGAIVVSPETMFGVIPALEKFGDVMQGFGEKMQGVEDRMYGRSESE